MRPRHPDKGLEALIRDAEAQGWVAQHNPKTGYYKLRCECGLHLKWVKKTPSGANYEKNLRAWLQRQSCWKG